MKKILIIIALFLGLYQGVFSAVTSVGVKCASWNLSLINWNNYNNLANTNSMWVCSRIAWNKAYVDFFDYSGQNISTFWPIYHWWSYYANINILWWQVVNVWNYSYYVLHTIDTSLNSYWIDVFQINKKTGAVFGIDFIASAWIRYLTPNIYNLYWTSTRSYWGGGAFTPYFTFDNTNIYFYTTAWTNIYYWLSFNLVTWNVNIPIAPNTPKVNNFAIYTTNTFDVSTIDYDRAIKRNVLDSNLSMYIYDSVSNTVAVSQIQANTNSNLVFKYFRGDLNEYFSSEWFTTYQYNFDTPWIINSFSWYLSYISSSGGSGNLLHTIPVDIWGLADYTKTQIYAIVSGTGSNERFWYMINWELFFNWDITLISNSTINTFLTIDSSLNTNTGGFITFNNTGTGGSLSTLFANANAWSGSFLPDKLNFLFTSAITKVNTGGLNSACKPMFDIDGVFNYTKNAKSTFLINLSKGNILSLGARWNMEILGVNTIGWLYDILDWLLTMIQQIFGTILNGFFGLFSDVTGAVNIPARNANYCFLGANIYLADNIKSYYSYSQKKNITVSGLNSIEMFYIFLLTIFLFVLIIKL